MSKNKTNRTGEYIKRLIYARPGEPARRAGIQALIAIDDIRELVDRGGFEAVSIEKLRQVLPK